MPNRYVCTVLEEIRTAITNHEKAISELDVLALNSGMRHLRSLTEEVQTLVNRMEAALYDWGDYEEMLSKKRKLKKEIIKLKDDKANLSGDEADIDTSVFRGFRHIRIDD